MSLDQATIVANTKKYFDTAEKMKFMTPELMNFLGQSFIQAPATTNTDMYCAFEGGLITHMLNVAKYAVKINNSLPLEEQVSTDSLVKICLLHQIGKANIYTPETSKWHRETLGRMYTFTENKIAMRVGERSLFYALSHGVILTEEESAAIIAYDKVDDKMTEYHNSMLGDLLKMGNVLAIKHERKKFSNELSVQE